jgi:hypothetical protein
VCNIRTQVPGNRYAKTYPSLAAFMGKEFDAQRTIIHTSAILIALWLLPRFCSHWPPGHHPGPYPCLLPADARRSRQARWQQRHGPKEACCMFCDCPCACLLACVRACVRACVCGWVFPSCLGKVDNWYVSFPLRDRDLITAVS